MELQQEHVAELNQFTGYGPGYVLVKHVRHEGSLLVTPTEIIPWRPSGFADLQDADWSVALAQHPALILLGTGSRIRFPAPALMQSLMAAHMGLEVLDTGALCRTFNALVSEGRSVVALLLPDHSES